MKWLIRTAVGLWAVAAVIAFVSAVAFSSQVRAREEETEGELAQLQQQYDDLAEEHLELQAWVIHTLRPWLQDQAEAVAGLDPAAPSPAPLPTPPPPSASIPGPSPSTSPEPPDGPSSVPSATPSVPPSVVPTCVPGTDICVDVGGGD